MIKIFSILLASILFTLEAPETEICTSGTCYAGYCLNGQTGQTNLACTDYNAPILVCTGCTGGCPGTVVEEG